MWWHWCTHQPNKLPIHAFVFIATYWKVIQEEIKCDGGSLPLLQLAVAISWTLVNKS